MYAEVERGPLADGLPAAGAVAGCLEGGDGSSASRVTAAVDVDVVAVLEPGTAVGIDLLGSWRIRSLGGHRGKGRCHRCHRCWFGPLAVVV